MTQTFIFNNPPGSFRVLQPSGLAAFDSRYATQKIYLTGVALVPLAGVTIPYGKTFAKVPYVRSAARLIDSSGSSYADYQVYYPPRITWSRIPSTGAQFFSGNYTAAAYSSMVLGSAWTASYAPGRYNFLYAVFENPVQ